MAPRKRTGKCDKNVKGKVVNKGRKKKISNQNAPPFIRIEIPTALVSESETNNKKARVVTSQKLRTVPAPATGKSNPRIVTNPNLSKNEIKIMLANEVVQAHFGKKPTDTKPQTQQQNMKRKPGPKKITDGENFSMSIVTTLPAMDSNGSAFEETTTKRKKGRTLGWKKKNEENSITTDAEICENNPTKRRYLPKLGVNKTNPRMKRKVSQTRMVSVDESKPRKRRKKDDTNITAPNNEHLQIASLHSECDEDVLIENPVRRKTSVASETLSWTKDISSSSTTTCITVSTNDFFLFDNKVPIVKLTNISDKLEVEEINDIKSETLTDIDSKDEMRSITEGNTSSAALSRARSLSLSSSSSSSSSALESDSRISVKTSVLTRGNSNIDDAMDKLTADLNNFDLEIMNWIGYCNEERNEIKRNFHDKFFNVLKEESDVILHCQNIQRILLDDDFQLIFSPDETRQNSEPDEQIEDFVRPDTVIEANGSNNPEKVTAPVSKNVHEKDPQSTDVLDIGPFDDRCNDDDDALSLFAESISGFESYRKSSTVTSAQTENSNEYVPQPITKNAIKTGPSITYKPTKINTDTTKIEQTQITKPVLGYDSKFCELHAKTKAVCEKQNADSTSIFKEPEPRARNLLKSSEVSIDTVHFGETSEQTSTYLNSASTPQNSMYPTLISSRYKGISCAKSLVFSGVCFFNLANRCKNTRCRFVHVHLDIDVVKIRLSQITEESFIKEYMLIRGNPVLRKKYGLLFVLEAINRNLTPLVIEIAIDFETKSSPNLKDDVSLKVEVLEQTLLYLNNIDIQTCTDLLTFHIRNGECICDIFMQTLAETQNFSRFKTVFINLTNFMYQIPRQFSLNVASSLLERVCILPFEVPLALALLKVLKRTSPGILRNSMFNHFEELLSCENKKLYDQLRDFKSQIVHNFSSVIPTPSYDVDNINSIVLGEMEKRCSPDTTNFDHTAKTFKEPVLAHSVDSNKLWSRGQTSGLINNSKTSLGQPHNIRDSQRVFCQGRNDKSIFNKTIVITNTNLGTSMMRPARPNFKR